MNLKPIHTDDDYEAALQEIDRLWDAQPGTEESDQLEIWATLVEAYEAGRYELPPPDPIQAIEYYLESRGLSRRFRTSYWQPRESIRNPESQTPVDNRHDP